MLNLALTNIYAKGKDLTLFHRVGRELRITKERTFLPYIYNPSPTGVYRGYFGEQLAKVFFKEPHLIPVKRTRESREADVVYMKRYMIDKINIQKAELRWVMFDIETQSKDFPDPLQAKDKISCVTTYDNYTKEYRTFWLPEYKSEYEMLESFIKYIKELQPDLLVGYNAYGFDYPYLCNRVPDFAQKISPINEVVKKNGFPAGISILDYYDFVKKIYKFKKYTLDYVYCDTFKIKSELVKPDFFVLNAEIKNKNRKDVEKLVELESKFHLISYFDELRRLSKVLWEDLTMFSVLVDGFMLQTAKEKGVILPTKPDEEEKLRRLEEDEITGGYVYADPGLHENVHLFDVGGTYPSMIVTFNLDPANKRREPNEQTTTIRNVHILQDSSAIVPSVCNRLITTRKELQRQIALSTNSEEQELLKQKDAANKSINNSVYGTLLFRSSRLYDKDIASAITYLARFLIRYTKHYLYNSGYRVVASDTDSIFVKTTEDYKKIEDIINNVIIPKWLQHFGKTQSILKFKFEGTFRNLFILTKKHYIGNMIKEGEERKIIKGIEVLRSDSSRFQEEFQETLLDKILNKETQFSVERWIKTEMERMKTLPLTEFSFPCKLSKPPEEYKSESAHVRALRYAQDDDPTWQVRIGQDFYYCFIVPERNEVRISNRNIRGELKECEIKKAMDVMAFDEFHGLGRYRVDWDKMLDRNVLKKVDAIYSAMGWDISNLRVQKDSPIVPKKSAQTRGKAILVKTENDTVKEVEVPKIASVEKIEQKEPEPIVVQEDTISTPYFQKEGVTLYLSDCRKVLRQLPDDCVDLVFTSPPYNCGDKGSYTKKYEFTNDNLSGEEYFELLSSTLKESLRICKGLVFININYMKNNMKEVFRLPYEFSDYLKETIIWDKITCQPPIQNILGKRHEFIFLFTKNKDFKISDKGNNLAKNHTEYFGNWISNVIQLKRGGEKKHAGIHQATFPTKLPEIFIDIYTKEGDTVLDPFLGTGSTGIASQRLKRKFIGTELSEPYIKIAVERLDEKNLC